MFKTNIRTEGEVATVELIGDLDTNASDIFISDVSKLIDANITTFVMDMRDLAFLSSSGLRKLLAISKMVQAKGGEMKVENVSVDVMQIFSLTGFDTLLGLKK